jgi:mRNA-degrading endonuclease RelE of RelBE toxin-antitoxin system
MMPKYQIKASTSIAKKWQAMEKILPEAMGRCTEFLQQSPLDRTKSGGKLKKLKGKLRGILQYDIDDSNRVRYEVDDKEQAVLIKYIGPHP